MSSGSRSGSGCASSRNNVVRRRGRVEAGRRSPRRITSVKTLSIIAPEGGTWPARAVRVRMLMRAQIGRRGRQGRGASRFGPPTGVLSRRVVSVWSGDGAASRSGATRPPFDSLSAAPMLILLAACAAGATFAILPPLTPLLRCYALARPNARSSHKQPTPQGCGAAVVGVALVLQAILTALAP